MNRRHFLAGATLLPAAFPAPKKLPAAPVVVQQVPSYAEDLNSILSGMFDQLGGLRKLVNQKTVTIKLNLTGSPALRFQGRALGVTHYSHPKTVGSFVHLLGEAGAKRIRLVESAWGTGGPLGEYMLDAGWNVRSLQNAAKNVELVNTNSLQGSVYKKYVRFPVPKGGFVFSAFDLHPVFSETDVMVSMAKLKNHATCGITLAMKNCFGNTPASLYGDDAGVDDPNESPTSGRVAVCHLGKRQPAKAALPEKDVSSSRSPEHRMPRISAEIAAARPIDIAFIDGIETVSGGEGPWIKGLQYKKPGLLVLGTNAVCTDTVGAALMGYDPRALRGTPPFANCDNMLLLAEQLGLGTADLRQIEVRGTSIEKARFPFA
jgi:uncharacterized protein (DUF362 family)